MPLPRFNLFRYSGVFAPNSKLRKNIIPNPQVSDPKSLGDEDDSSLPAAKYSWSQLMKRSFGIDMSKCPNCGSENFKVVAVIEDYKIVEKILTHIGLQARAPPITSARTHVGFEYQEFID